MFIRSFLTALALMLSVGCTLAQDKVKVIYHYDNTEAQATADLRTLRNNMDTVPNTQIVVVVLGDGVRFLMEDAKDQKNNSLQCGPLISDLVAKGVTFEICELTMRAMDLKKDQFVLDAGFTPLGRGPHRPPAIPRWLRLHQALNPNTTSDRQRQSPATALCLR